MSEIIVSAEELVKLESEQQIGFLEELENSLRAGADIAVASDYDHTLSDAGRSDDLDVSVTYIQPEAKEAFERIISSGRDVVIISARGARDIAENIVNIPGISVIGSLGYETLDREGHSRVNPLFDPFRKQISAILGEVEERFVREQLGLESVPEETPIVRFPTDEGDIIRQPKGYNELFPHGINNAYSFHLVPNEKADKYIEALKEYYDEVMERQLQGLSPSEQEELKRNCHFQSYSPKTLKGVEVRDADIGPVLQGGKGDAILQLMMTTGDKRRLANFSDMPSHNHWIYSGDILTEKRGERNRAVQDGAAMRALHLAKVISRGHLGGETIWSMPLKAVFRENSWVNATVNGVGGVASIFSKAADLMEQYPVKTN